MPGVVRLAECPIAFLRADNDHLINVTRFEQLSGEVQRRHADGCVTDERVARAVDAEQRCEMAGRRIVDRFGKKERARGVRTLTDDLLVKASGCRARHRR
jgi:hypothetical protein